MKKLKFFIATFAVVACATILSVRAISYSHEAMFANIEALSGDGDPDPNNQYLTIDMFRFSLSYSTDIDPAGGHKKVPNTQGDCEWTATPYDIIGKCIKIVKTRKDVLGY